MGNALATLGFNQPFFFTLILLANCQRALETAEVELGIPPILSAQHLSSTHLDQNSCLAYLSFFTRENGPAFHATLAHVQNLVDDIRIRDFGSSWSDGHLLCRLVTAVGGCISAFEKDEMVYDRTHWTWNCRQALDAAVDLGVVPLVGADEIADAHNDDHIGLMALCAALCSLSPVPLRSEKAAVVHTSCLQHQQLNLDLAFAERSELDVEDLTIVVIGPNGPIDEAELPISKQKTEHGAVLSFVPHLLGAYRVHILCEEVELSTSPIALEVLPAPTAADEPPEDEMSDFFEGPPIGQVSFSGLSEPCSIGSVVEVVINAQGGEAAGEVEVLSISPNGTQHQCEVIHRANFFTAIFKPEEIGDWKIHILYDKEPIRGSPFSCQVFDAERVSVQGLDVGLVNRRAQVRGRRLAGGHGRGEVEEIGGRNRYKVRFTPEGPGKDYRIHIFFNDMEIKGSPFILDIADASNVSVHGDELKAAVVGRPATFFVQATGAELKDVNVVITGEPQMVGEHLIDVQVYEQSVQDPFVCNVGDPARVTVSRVPNWIDVDGLNRDLSFEVDAVEGGVGELELLINGGRVTCRAVPHTIEMKFNGHQVRGSPWKIPLRGATVFTSPKSQLTSALPQSGADHSSASASTAPKWAEIAYFDITTSSGQLKPADVDVRLEGESPRPPPHSPPSSDPNGRPVETRVLPLRSALRCEFSIRQVGDHRLEVRINGRLIDSGPLTVAGFDLHKVRVQPVRANGVGNPAQFTASPPPRPPRAAAWVSV
ncbi:hypothetical protein M3Y99_00046600 [Aphelenchoides fujianensis]|nr:hypothetical protein M3Y99_00046600 [Aphelenchoides fujianensis]